MDVGNPLISVIMPAYNAAEFIEEAIDSILNQTYSHLELLICDDGSNDETLKVIQSFKDDRIKLFQNIQNLGNLKTTNFLFEECKGDFITIQDADDYSLPNRLEILLNAFDSDIELEMVGTNYLAVSENKTPLFSGFLPRKDLQIRTIAEKEVVPMLYASIMVRANLLKKVGGFRLFFNRLGYADFDWMARCMESSQRALNLRDVLYIYRKHTHSFTAKKKKNSLLVMFHPLIVEMHKRRGNGLEDYFETNNIVQIKRMVSQMYIAKAKANFWDRKGAVFSYLWKSIIFNPRNVDSYRTLFYILRNRNDKNQ